MKLFWVLASVLLTLLGFIVIISLPFTGDEGLYAIAIKDVQRLGLQPYATYFGEPMFWKPPMMFNIYAVMGLPLSSLGVPDHISLRLVSLVIIVASSLLIFKLVKEDFDERTAYISITLFLATMQIFMFGYRALTDTLSLFFLIAALCSIAEYCKQKSRFLLSYSINIFALGLTKSHTLAIFAIVLGIAYYIFKNRPNVLGNNAWQLAFASLAPILLLLAYPLLLGDNSSGFYYLLFGDSSRFSISSVLFNAYPTFAYTAPLGALAIVISGISIARRNFGFYEFWVVLSFLTIFSSISFLPWYFTYFAPAFAVVVASRIRQNPIDRIMLIALIAISLMYLAVMEPNLTPFKDENEIQQYIRQNKPENLLVVTRLGEGIIYETYGLKNVARVTPENGFHSMQNGEKYFYGIKKETIEAGNMRGLIHNYNNAGLHPKFIHLFSASDRFMPPVGRTVKDWEGDFEIIIAQDVYAEVIKEVAPEYRVVHITKNGEFYVFEKR